MAEKTEQKPFRWTAQNRREALLRFALGETSKTIANKLGCSTKGLYAYFGTRKAMAALIPDDLTTLFQRFDTERNIAELLSAPSGSVEQARLRTSLRNMWKIQPGRASKPQPDREDTMKSLKQIKEMSQDELQAYVATLAPGLECKTAAINDKTGKAPDGNGSVSDDGPASTKTATAEFSQLVVDGRARRRQNPRRG